MQEKIVIVSQNRKYREKWVQAIKSIQPELIVEVYPKDTRREETEYILAFRPPVEAINQFPNLKVIASMAAGVKHILNLPNLPRNVQITKMNDRLHKRDMALFTLSLVLNYIKSLQIYRHLQGEKKWIPQDYIDIDKIRIGIMGLGSIGRDIGNYLVVNGFNITGWSRSQKSIQGIQSFHGKGQFNDFLTTADILINILPLTDETKGILNHKVFRQLPDGAYLINIGRGGHLVEEDLTEAISSGKLSGAALDVFQEEPLAVDHPFWENEKITITPHVGGNTNLNSAAKTAMENFQRFNKGEKLKDLIDIHRGY